MDAVERARTELVNSPHFNLPNAGVLLLEPDTLRIYRANARAQEILGYDAHTLHQMSFYDLCIEEPTTVQAKLDAYQQSSKPGDCDVRVASGEWRIIEVAPKYFEKANLIQVLFADLTGIRLAWRMLTQVVAYTARLSGEGYLKSLVRALARTLRANYGYVGELTGPDQVHGLALWAEEDWQTPFDYSLIYTPCHQVINQSACLYPHSVQTVFPQDEVLKTLGVQSYAGVPLHDTRGRPIGILWVCGKNPLPNVPELLEILESVGARASAELERIRIERELHTVREQLLQAQRMDSIGQMAGGIAHDFNNMLTAILGYIELAQGELDPQSRAYTFLESALRGVDKATQFTRQLLVFARRQPMQIRPIQLNEVVQEALEFAKRWLPSNIQVQLFLADDLWLVEGDSAQLVQVLNNLFLNARDAMPQGGTLTVETQNILLDTNYAQSHYEVVPGDYVLLSVSDTGVGIPSHSLKRIFEPFFTTKPQGQGSGLGLTVVYSVIKQLGGHIWVYSEEGKGTTFKIYLPRAVSDYRVPTVTLPPAPIERGTETILFVEDEPEVRAVTEEALQLYGYTVLSASTPTEALQLAEKHTIDLMVTDVVLPMMSGRELAELVKRMHPTVRVLYVSGYTENTIVHHGILQEGIHFLPKPYTPSQLLIKVRQILDEVTEP